MKIFKENPRAKLPEYATKGSACFDLRACFDLGQQIVGYNPLNKKILIPTKLVGGKVSLQIHPQYRVLIPTGLIFDIPEEKVMKIFIRSSGALKHGLTLANCTAIIDSDYVDPTYILLMNISDSLVVVTDDERIAQAKLEDATQEILEETTEKPLQKTDRNGGHGSTGKA